MKHDRHDTERLLAYLSGELGGAEVAAVEARLLKEEDLRRTLLELAVEEETLTDWAAAERTLVALDNKVFEEAEPRTGKMAGLRQPWLAAAAVLVVGLVGLAASLWRSGPTANSGVARIVASIDAEWRGEAPGSRDVLPEGDYQLEAGMIDLLFADGARVEVRGPARFELRGSGHLHLESGTLVAQISDEALGFVVTSPQSEVIDLGTEFGVSVSADGSTDVHVLDGLVEVMPGEAGVGTKSVQIPEGEARRFAGVGGDGPTSIPLSSRAGLLGDDRLEKLGVRMLRGAVRMTEELSARDLSGTREGEHWIELIAERQGVALEQPLEVTLDAPGSYRDFNRRTKKLLPGTSVSSYLLHFRPTSEEPVRGVIRFDEPIVGVICTKQHLNASDTQFGVPSVHYPSDSVARGLEPGLYFSQYVAKAGWPDPFQPDEVIISQDRTAISIHATATPETGYYDQVRVLTRSRDP
jgi:ferric-dicitrate binding protein FerR (iron transport regulator)